MKTLTLSLKRKWFDMIKSGEKKANKATCKELKAYNVVASSETENYINGETNLAFEAYDADDVDALLAKKDAEIAELKKKLMPCLNGDCILTCEVVEKYGKENAELKKKLEDAKATAYAESVDAGMRERRLKRALWNLRVCYADMMQKRYIECKYDGWVHRVDKWIEVERKCRAKAEEYK